MAAFTHPFDTTRTPTPGDRPRPVLLVEDDPSHAELVRRAFRSHPEFQLSTVDSLVAARVAILQSVPDLVIADLLLPDGHGRSLLAERTPAGAFPVVMLTSHGDEAAAVEAIKAGARDYIVKSDISLQELPRTVERALREWDQSQALQRAEAANQRTQALLKSVTDSVPLGLIVVAPDRRRVLYFNPRFGELWGLETRALSKLPAPEIEALCRARVQGPPEMLAPAGLLGVSGRVTLDDEIILLDGRTIRRCTTVVEEPAAPLKPDGQDCRLYTFEDVSARKQSERLALERTAALARLEVLTRRERQVLELVAVGRSNKVIAHSLSISVKTVELHRAHLMKKLRVESVADLVRVAVAAEGSGA